MGQDHGSWTDLGQIQTEAFSTWIGEDQLLTMGLAKTNDNSAVLLVGRLEGDPDSHQDFLESTMGFLKILGNHLEAS